MNANLKREQRERASTATNKQITQAILRVHFRAQKTKESGIVRKILCRFGLCDSTSS